MLNDNGAWSWFGDERAVVDPTAGTLIVSSVADASGSGGATRDGNVEVAVHHMTTETTRRAVLHAHLEDDDHDSASLHVRCDGRYVAMYSTHATDTLSRWRVSSGPGCRDAWGAERTLDHGAAATYSNIYPVGTGSSLYALVRAAATTPTSSSQKTTAPPGNSKDACWKDQDAPTSVRRGPPRTTPHPDDRTAPGQHATSIYHGMIVDGRLLRSDGTVVDADLSDDVADRPERLTRVFGVDDGMLAWTVDLHVDGDGRPYAALSVHARRNEYWYARYDGVEWHTHFLAHAGTALYDSEPYYTGLAALDPGDSGRVVVSTDVQPDTGVPLVSSADGQQHHELYEGTTINAGSTWEWAPVTADSTADNLRPIVPIWAGDQRALLWLRGEYTAYTTTTSRSSGCHRALANHSRNSRSRRSHIPSGRRSSGQADRATIRRTTSVLSAVFVCTWTTVITVMKRGRRGAAHPPHGRYRSRLLSPAHDGGPPPQTVSSCRDREHMLEMGLYRLPAQQPPPRSAGCCAPRRRLGDLQFRRRQALPSRGEGARDVPATAPSPPPHPAKPSAAAACAASGPSPETATARAGSMACHSKR